jgi:hypothetical protein
MLSTLLMLGYAYGAGWFFGWSYENLPTASTLGRVIMSPVWWFWVIVDRLDG